jgi:hypothetical protein
MNKLKDLDCQRKSKKKEKKKKQTQGLEIQIECLSTCLLSVKPGVQTPVLSKIYKNKNRPNYMRTCCSLEIYFKCKNVHIKSK